MPYPLMRHVPFGTIKGTCPSHWFTERILFHVFEISLDRHYFLCENSETEFSSMTNMKQHEYDLLNEIGQDPMVTQAGLSNRLGIAVGSVNWYIKRLIHRGWVKVSHLDRTRLKYDLTKEGMAVLTERALLYARDSLKVYSDYRKKAKALVAELRQKEIRQVYLEGENEDEPLDILRLTCIEAGIQVSRNPQGVVIKVDGQNYRVKLES
jgi:DNA-binding MarR family transcriptional regulator